MTKTDPVAVHPEVYRPPAGRVSIIDVPAMTFASVDGYGRPRNSRAWREAADTLRGVSLAVRTLEQADGRRAVHAPLEASWRMDGLGEPCGWTTMIAQPDDLTNEGFIRAIVRSLRKRDLPALERLRLERSAGQRCALILHVGPYATIGASIERLEAGIAAAGCRWSGVHREIYLSDPERVRPDRLRTVIGHPVGSPASHPRPADHP